MASENDILFARAALKKGYLAVEGLTEALSEQAALRREGREVPLDRLLADRGHVTAEQRKRLRAAIRRHRRKVDIRGYEIYEQVGRGGMGTVYRARQLSLDRIVALKLLPKETVGDAADVRRFLREARLAASLNHRSIVQVFEVGEVEDRYFIAMEFVTGRTLESLADGGEGFSQGQALRLAAGIARGLAHAHAKGVIHRDLKPANVIVPGEGEVKIVDFGLAVGFGRPSEKITKAGIVLGTPEYIAPEQARSPADIEASADVYSLGAILYHLLAGRPPFEGRDILDVLGKVFRRQFDPLAEARPGLVPEVYELVDEAMAARPGDRPAARAFAEQAESILEAHPRLLRKKRKGSSDTHVIDLSRALPEDGAEPPFALRGWTAVIVAVLAVSALFFVIVLLTASWGGEAPEEPGGGGTGGPGRPAYDNVPVSLRNDAEARRLLEEALRFLRDYPGAREEGLAKLRRIVEKYPGTLGAYQARDEIEKLTAGPKGKEKR